MKETKKPHSFKVKNKHGVLKPYSGTFPTKKEAFEWYNNKKEWFREKLGRELIYCDSSFVEETESQLTLW